MALPSLGTAKYELTLPSTGEKVEYRPFLVKEEKVFMVAQATGNQNDMLRAVEQIIADCTFGKLQPKTLPFFDIEYVFLKLRAKSIGETVEVNITCPDDNETKVPVEINLSDIECKRDVTHSPEVKLTDTVGMTLEYPRVEAMNIDANKPEEAFKMIAGCVRQIYDAENVYDKADMSQKDLDEFIESMTHDQFQKVQSFFETMPRVKHPVKVKNPKTGVESEVVLEGMQSFF